MIQTQTFDFPTSRANRITAILLREETLDILNAVEQHNTAFLFSSYAIVHTFADLISEDLIILKDGQLSIAPLAVRFIEQIGKK